MISLLPMSLQEPVYSRFIVLVVDGALAYEFVQMSSCYRAVSHFIALRIINLERSRNGGRWTCNSGCGKMSGFEIGPALSGWIWSFTTRKNSAWRRENSQNCKFV